MLASVRSKEPLRSGTTVIKSHSPIQISQIKINLSWKFPGKGFYQEFWNSLLNSPFKLKEFQTGDVRKANQIV